MTRQAGLAAGALAASLVLGACDGSATRRAGAPLATADTDTDTGGATDTDGVLALPRAIADTRAIDPGRLRVEVTVGATPVPVERDANGRWVGRFSLSDDGAYTLDVLWRYDYAGVELELARSRPRQISRADPRGITVSAYVTTAFDFDADGTDNLSEIDAGSDPLRADPPLEPMPGVGQADCRQTSLEGIPGQERPRDLYAPLAPFERSYAVESAAGQVAYLATFYVRERGVLSVVHTGGEPQDTDAQLYERPAGTTTAARQAVVSARSGAPDAPPDGQRAALSADVAPGIYCYLLADETAATAETATVLSDTVLLVTFEAETFAAARR